MPATRKGPGNRAKLTNGTAMFLGGVDMRSERGRRFADVIEALIAERGGFDALSMTQREAIRTYAGLVVERDLMHAQRANGEKIDPEALGQIGDRMARQERIMGKPPEPKRLGLREHLAARRDGGGRA